MEINCEKMIFAVLSAEDASELVADLNSNGFYATLLSSTGGFLRKKSVTLMIGLEKARLEEALGILKKHAGARMETTYLTGAGMIGMPAMPTKVACGGITAFILSMDGCVKY